MGQFFVRPDTVIISAVIYMVLVITDLCRSRLPFGLIEKLLYYLAVSISWR